jgi:hypothetical protein
MHRGHPSQIATVQKCSRDHRWEFGFLMSSIGESMNIRELLTHIKIPAGCVSVGNMEVIRQVFSIFPIGKGTLEEKDRYSVLVLGNDWGNERQRNERLTATQPHPSERAIRSIIENGDFDLNDCFFGNSYLALRQGDAKTMGRCAMHDDPEFVRQCLAFWQEFIQFHKVHTIITFGVVAAWFAGQLFSGHSLKDAPQSIGIKDLPAEVQRIEGRTYVHLVHPVMRHLNIKRREQNLARYDNSELAYLKAAHRKAGLAAGTP